MRPASNSSVGHRPKHGRSVVNGHHAAGGRPTPHWTPGWSWDTLLATRFQNASDATPHFWGEERGLRTYTLRPAYTLIDEGDEPWFPPSEDAVFWGGVARWFMGLLFLLPVIYLVVHVKRSQAFAAAVAAKKARLLWYIERLDSGESSAKQARMDMSKALRAVSELEWIDGLEVWGPKRLEHRTEDIALAVWSVDPRLATSDKGWPIVVGVHVLNGTLDLAALRFDAPEGQGFEVTHVEPRFLFQGEEVFLDTMGPGHRTYLVVELVGPAQRVDVELNGHGRPTVCCPYSRNPSALNVASATAALFGILDDAGFNIVGREVTAHGVQSFSSGLGNFLWHVEFE